MKGETVMSISRREICSLFSACHGGQFAGPGY